MGSAPRSRTTSLVSYLKVCVQWCFAARYAESLSFSVGFPMIIGGYAPDSTRYSLVGKGRPAASEGRPSRTSGGKAARELSTYNLRSHV